VEIEEFERYLHLGRQSDAHRLVGVAIREGKLKKQPCVICGERLVDGHHRDYGKPLEVLWLCRGHHRIFESVERMVKQCWEVVPLAVEGGFLPELAEVFTSELTSSPRRNPQLKCRSFIGLRQDVEKCFTLLFLSS
jgi:hypothetical protein